MRVPSSRMDADFARFRAAYPTVRAALDGCTRPDWLLLLAWEALDHKTAADLGLGAARILRSRTNWWFVNPNPDRLEAVQTWAGTDDDTTQDHATGRAISLSWAPGAALAYVTEYLILPAVFPERSVHRYGALMFAFAVVCIPAIRGILGAVVRRRAARLDDSAVLNILLASIRAGMAGKPRLVEVVMKLVGRRVRRLVEAETR